MYGNEYTCIYITIVNSVYLTVVSSLGLGRYFSKKRVRLSGVGVQSSDSMADVCVVGAASERVQHSGGNK